jgi:NAD(P)-dependent dehydrogenase (short-subunit alcohol dehydrogenase family)
VVLSSGESAFDGKVIAITGGSSGIGLATAELAVRGGARVAIMARGAERLTASAAHLREFAVEPSDVMAHQGDAGQAGDVAKLFARTVDELGGLDGFAAVAGSPRKMDLLDGDVDEWERAFHDNLTSALLGARAAAEHLTDPGAIVLVGSMAARRVSQYSLAYGIAKAGVSQLAKGLALRLAAEGIRVNCVVPGFVDTPMSDETIRARGEGDPEKERRIRRARESWPPMGRVARAEEVAEAICFLLSSHSSYVTGIDLVVDGGEVAAFGQIR